MESVNTLVGSDIQLIWYCVPILAKIKFLLQYLIFDDFKIPCTCKKLPDNHKKWSSIYPLRCPSPTTNNEGKVLFASKTPPHTSKNEWGSYSLPLKHPPPTPNNAEGEFPFHFKMPPPTPNNLRGEEVPCASKTVEKKVGRRPRPPKKKIDFPRLFFLPVQYRCFAFCRYSRGLLFYIRKYVGHTRNWIEIFFLNQSDS